MLPVSHQALYQDIVAYEHVIDSTKVKAQELVVTSPRSQVAPRSSDIVKRYFALKEKVKVGLYMQNPACLYVGLRLELLCLLWDLAFLDL